MIGREKWLCRQKASPDEYIHSPYRGGGAACPGSGCRHVDPQIRQKPEPHPKTVFLWRSDDLPAVSRCWHPDRVPGYEERHTLCKERCFVVQVPLIYFQSKYRVNDLLPGLCNSHASE